MRIAPIHWTLGIFKSAFICVHLRLKNSLPFVNENRPAPFRQNKLDKNLRPAQPRFRETELAIESESE